jgi:hypothetical protein
MSGLGGKMAETRGFQACTPEAWQPNDKGEVDRRFRVPKRCIGIIDAARVSDSCCCSSAPRAMYVGTMGTHLLDCQQISPLHPFNLQQ